MIPANKINTIFWKNKENFDDLVSQATNILKNACNEQPMTDCDLCTCIPNVLQSIQIHLLSSLHNIFHITTDVHIQSLGDFLFLLIDISAPGRPGQNWSSILTPFQRIHWQIHSVYSKKTQFYLYLLLIWIVKHSLYVIHSFMFLLIHSSAPGRPGQNG